MREYYNKGEVNMGITRKILNWTDKNVEEAIANNEDVTKKAMVSAFVEGLVDGAVIIYPLMVVACHYWEKQSLKK